MSDMDEICEVIAFLTKHRKEKLCAEVCGPEDVPPSVIGVDDDNDPFLVSDREEGDPVERIADLLGVVAEGLERTTGEPKWRWVAYVSEAFGGEPLPADAPPPAKGSLEDDFMNNPNTNVTQLILVNIHTWDGAERIMLLPYVYGDDGMPVWVETEQPWDDDSATDGIIPEIFRRFRAFCHSFGNAE